MPEEKDSYISFCVDNEGSRDLDDAQSIFKKYAPISNNRIFFYIKDKDKYVLNGHPIEFNEENFTIFKALLRFFTRISEGNPQDFVIEDSFERGKKSLKRGKEEALQKANDDDKIRLVNDWDSYWVKETADLTNKTLTKNIEKYFE